MGCLIQIKLTEKASKAEEGEDVNFLFLYKNFPEFFSKSDVVEKGVENSKFFINFYVVWPENRASYFLQKVNLDRRVYKTEIIS